MKIITLTTDLGLKDHYVASIKATLLTKLPGVNIIDISHDVKAFDVSEAAYHLNACFKSFPNGTVHVIGVDSEPIINFGNNDGSFPSILEFENQYFISNDSGFFGAFLKEAKPDKFWRIDDVLSNPNLFLFPTKNILCETGIKILNGDSIDSFASLHENYNNAFVPVAIHETNLIKGHVLHIDNYGNLITNIDRTLFEQVGAEIPFTIFLKKKEYYIDVISQSYNEAAQGETVALFNENSHLEIAINRGATNNTGGADKLLGLKTGDLIRIEFTPKGSHKTIDSLFNDY